MTLTRYSLLLFLLHFTTSGLAQTRRDTIFDIDRTVWELMHDWNIPGVSLAVVKNGETFITKGYGIRNLETNLPVDEHTLFSIASCSKAFTATAAALLDAQGKIDLDEPIKNYLPEFEMSDPYTTAHISLRDMLCHRSGLPRHDMIWHNSGLDRYEIYERLKFLPVTNPLYKEYEYNNVMYVIAGVIIEKMTGTTLEDFLSQHIFQPLEMEQSVWFNKQMKENPNHAISYVPDETGKFIPQPLYDHGDVTAAAGGVKTSAKDMANWLKFQLGNGTFKNKKILPGSYVQDMHRGHILMQDAVSEELGAKAYGLGWVNTSYKGLRYIQHRGAREGYWSQVNLFPDKHFAVYVNTNSGGVSVYFTESLSLILTDYFMGLEKTDWNSRNKQKFNKEKKRYDTAEDEIESKLIVGSVPQHPLSGYVGIYTHPAFGNIEVIKSDKQLTARFRRQDFSLRHMAKNNFYGKTALDRLVFEFGETVEKIDRIQLNLQGIPIVFNKREK